MIPISIITPIYDVEKHLKDYAENMRLLQKEFDGITDIILVNNNTSKRINGSKALAGLKNLKVIENMKNVGFGRACNQGMRIAKGKLMLILNPDLKIDGSSLQKLVSEMENSRKAKILSCKLLNDDGSLQYSCRRFPTIRALLARRIHFPFRFLFKKEAERYDMRDYDHLLPRKVDWVSGALMLMREKYFFDERYFMYFEDIDLCRSVGSVYYFPSVSAYHRAERKSARHMGMLIAHVTSSLRYFMKFGLKNN